MHRQAVFGLAALVVFLGAASAAAQEQPADAEAVEEDARVSDVAKALFVSAGLGPSIQLDGGPAQLRVVEEVGIHLEGRTVGAFAALAISEEFLSFYRMQIGVRVGWDLALLSRDFAIVVTPSVLVAFAFDALPGGATFAYFDPQFCLGVALLLLEGWLEIWIRPIAIDIYIGDPAIHSGYSGLLGATINLGI